MIIMSEVPVLILSGAAGVVLGTVFFGGLWWTLRKALTSRSPALWFASSVLLRMGLTLFGFYFVSGGNWQQLVACLVGFSLARVAITRLTRPPPGKSQEVGHAAHS